MYMQNNEEKQEKPKLTNKEAQIILNKVQDRLAELKEEQNNNLIHKLELEGIYQHDYSLPLYKYVSYERALQILSNRTIKYSICKDFNDLFELNDALLDVNYDEAIQSAKGLALSKAPHLSEEEVKLLSNILNDRKGLNCQRLKQFFENAKNKLGIFCASKTYLNNLMWSHYADSHKGVCLGFYIKPTQDEKTYTYLRVTYKKYLKPVRYSFIDKSTQILALLYWTHVKSKVWEYEQEIRVINFKQNGIVSLENMEIKEIYYGANMPEENEQELEDTLNNKVYNIFKKGKMKFSKNSFNLEVIER